MDRNRTIGGLALLKVAFMGREEETAILDSAIEMLKEQEPVKVYHLHGTKVTMHEEIVFTDECGNCYGYLLKPWKACPICGKKVKWDEP